MVSSRIILGGHFLFLRHGQTQANAADIVAGVTDVPLSATGRQQARAAAEALDDVEFAAIWCSSLARARDTAQIIATRSGRALRVVPELGERDWGDWEGRPRSVLVREATPPSGESPYAFAARIEKGISHITAPWPALIVAHSGTARVLWRMLGSRQTFHRPGNAELSEWRQRPDGRWAWKVIHPAPNCHPAVAERN